MSDLLAIINLQSLFLTLQRTVNIVLFLKYVVGIMLTIVGFKMMWLDLRQSVSDQAIAQYYQRHPHGLDFAIDY